MQKFSQKITKKTTQKKTPTVQPYFNFLSHIFNTINEKLTIFYCHQ